MVWKHWTLCVTWEGGGRAGDWVARFHDSPPVTGWESILTTITAWGWELVAVVAEQRASSYYAAPPAVQRYRLFCKQPA